MAVHSVAHARTSGVCCAWCVCINNLYTFLPCAAADHVDAGDTGKHDNDANNVANNVANDGDDDDDGDGGNDNAQRGDRCDRGRRPGGHPPTQRQFRI